MADCLEFFVFFLLPPLPPPPFLSDFAFVFIICRPLLFGNEPAHTLVYFNYDPSLCVSTLNFFFFFFGCLVDVVLRVSVVNGER